jgi:uncharacterized protein YjbJ (UPF0337 family)
MNRDPKAGAFENVKGRVKQAACVVTGDRDEESHGASERERRHQESRR